MALTTAESKGVFDAMQKMAAARERGDTEAAMAAYARAEAIENAAKERQAAAAAQRALEDRVGAVERQRGGG